MVERHPVIHTSGIRIATFPYQQEKGARTPEKHEHQVQRLQAFSVELRGIEPLTFSMRKTGTAVD
jgi:hypothetical protein